MLTKRIIPCLDIKDGRVVKGIKFVSLRDAGDPVQTARAYEEQKADELVFLDITASFEGRKTFAELVRKIADNIFMPFTVGGGVSGIEDIRRLLSAGADKVSINTAAVKSPKLVEQAARRFGSQCIVVAIDAKRRQNARGRASWEVYIHGGRTPTGLDAIAWGKKVQSLGAGEILLTSMDCDGTKDGFDIPVTKAMSRALRIPVIASGGAGEKRHFLDVFVQAGADAALAASVFHYGQLKVADVKTYLKKHAIPVRP
jgi:cyclase